MHSKLTLTVTALAVSIALTACKSGGTPQVIAKSDIPSAGEISQKLTKKPDSNQAKRTPQTTENSPAESLTNAPIDSNKAPETSDKGENPSDEKVNPNTADEKPTTPEEPATKPETTPQTGVTEVNEDSSGKLWRVIPLAKNASLADASQSRREDRDHFMLSDDEPSPFISTEDDYNYYLTLDLGKNDKNDTSYASLLKAGEDYLGLHKGSYNDAKLKDAQQIQYLYVNQPYSSYGAIFANKNDSNLFNIRLITGRDGKKQVEEGDGANYSEYGVFDIIDGKGHWKEGLTGDATYKGSVIARVEKNAEGEPVAFAPEVDGDVTLKLHLNNDWHKSSLSGTINSKALGTIQLNENNIAPAEYLGEGVAFYGETSVPTSPHLSGIYSTHLVGEKLNDAVGSIEIETDDDINDGITKYNAVFGGTKQ